MIVVSTKDELFNQRINYIIKDFIKFTLYITNIVTVSTFLSSLYSTYLCFTFFHN